jgi:hypothetical protein
MERAVVINEDVEARVLLQSSLATGALVIFRRAVVAPELFAKLGDPSTFSRQPSPTGGGAPGRLLACLRD